MNTPAHLLIGLAVFARRDLPGGRPAAAAGSLLPDLSLYLLAGSALLVAQIPPERVFGELYYSAPWQTVFAIDNSVPLWALALAVAAALRSPVGMAAAGAGLLHVAADFPLHAGDGRPHFWPLTDWIFDSPVSYWDSRHHAGLVAPVEAALAFGAAVLLWRRFAGTRWRVAVVLLAGLELWTVRQWLLFF